MDLDSAPKSPPTDPAPEVEMYLRLLILLHLLSSEPTHEQALDLANETVQKMQQMNRRSMDTIAGKIWYAVERAYDLVGDLSDARWYEYSTITTSVLNISLQAYSWLLRRQHPYDKTMKRRLPSSTAF